MNKQLRICRITVIVCFLTFVGAVGCGIFDIYYEIPLNVHSTINNKTRASFEYLI